MQSVFHIAVKINILYMQYIRLVVLKTGPTPHNTFGINTLTVLIACHRMLIPKEEGGFFFL